MRRPKADLLGLVERIVERYHKAKLTVREIEAELREEGVSIGKSSIHRTLQSEHDAASAYRTALAEARVMLEAVRGEPNTDVLELVTSFLSAKILKNVKDISSIDFDDPGALIDAVYRLTRAQVATGRLRMEFERGFEAARRSILDALGQDLRDDPDLAERMRARVAAIQPET
jgi:hypothetical protein